jgi:hypothetical protein
MMVCDTSGLFAALDDSQSMHLAARSAVEADPGPLFLSPFVLAELDYLLATRVGWKAESLFLKEVAEGAFRLEPFDSADLQQAMAIMDSHADASIGLADASVVVLARRHGINRILTLDQRHFRALQAKPGESFVLLPLD